RRTDLFHPSHARLRPRPGAGGIASRSDVGVGRAKSNRRLNTERNLHMKTIWTILAAAWFQCGGFNAALAAGDYTFTPSNPPAMKPLIGHDSPAQRAAQWFKRGVNLGDYLE